MSTPPPGIAAYDPLSPSVLDDPFPAYERLRRECPVHHNTGFDPPFFTLSRFDDVLAGLRDFETWSIRYGDSPHYMRPAGLFNDPPQHTPFRRIFNRSLTPRAVTALEADIEHLAHHLVDTMVREDSGDFQTLFASPLPMTIIARLIGVPETDLALFREMCNDLTATYNVADPAASAAPRARLDDYFQRHIDWRRHLVTNAEVPLPDDLLSRLVVAESDGWRPTDADLHLLLVLLLLGGLETSTALLTNVVWRLLQDRSRWQALQQDPALIDVAVEESLRHDPPVLGLFRTPTRDIELHGTTIPAKSKVMLAFASANREPPHDVRAPDEFRLDRDLEDVRRHLSFGFGVHFCPGAPLARLEGRISLRVLLQRLPDLHLDGPTERIEPFLLWGRGRLPLRWA